jgi:Holliday junction DNA helicase RuvB
VSVNEEAIERALRPKQLDEYVGQEKSVISWKFSSRLRASAEKHSITPLLFGPPA